MVKPVKNDLAKYGVPIAEHRRTDTAKVVPKPEGGWTVEHPATGQTGILRGADTKRADMLRAADAVILRHQEVIRKLAKR